MKSIVFLSLLVFTLLSAEAAIDCQFGGSTSLTISNEIQDYFRGEVRLSLMGEVFDDKNAEVDYADTFPIARSFVLGNAKKEISLSVFQSTAAGAAYLVIEPGSVRRKGQCVIK